MKIDKRYVNMLIAVEQNNEAIRLSNILFGENNDDTKCLGQDSFWKIKNYYYDMTEKESHEYKILSDSEKLDIALMSTLFSHEIHLDLKTI